MLENVGLLQAVDIFRSNSQKEIQDKVNEWYSKGYLVEYEFQKDAWAKGRYVIIAFVISDRKNIFQKNIDVDVFL